MVTILFYRRRESLVSFGSSAPTWTTNIDWVDETPISTKEEKDDGVYKPFITRPSSVSILDVDTTIGVEKYLTTIVYRRLEYSGKEHSSVVTMVCAKGSTSPQM